MFEELSRKVIGIIAASQKIEAEKITIDSTFEELGIDSLGGIQIVFALEEAFNVNIPDEQAQGIRTVRQVVENMQKLLSGTAGAEATAQ